MDWKILIALVLTLLITGIVVVFLRYRPRPINATSPTAARTLEAKLADLEKCGLRLSSSFTVKDLLESWPRQEFEKEGYELTLVGLGMTEEREPWRNHCINLWHFDTECIEDHGSYKAIAERMAEMTQGSLKLEEISDFVDVEAEKAWLSFKFKGDPVRIDLKVQDDWVDTRVFDKFVELLRRADQSKVYIYYDLRGQDCLLGCVTRTELECLRQRGLKFEELTRGSVK